MLTLPKFISAIKIVGLILMVNSFPIYVRSQEDCGDNCTNEQKAALICKDIFDKVDESFVGMDDQYRNFQEKYDNNINLIGFSIRRLGQLGTEVELMDEVMDSIDNNNDNLQQLYDSMARDVLNIQENCEEDKIDLEVIKFQADIRNFDQIMGEINKDLKSLKNLIQNI